MKVITNEKMIKRNARLGKYANYAGLILLGGVMVLSFTNPTFFNYYWIGLFLGFTLSQVGIYFRNRWGRNPRPDELLDQGLKSLNDQYSFYHYSSPIAHLLVGPAGVWAIIPYYQTGRIVYEKNRYKQKGGGALQRYLRVVGQEGIGRPELDAAAEVNSITRFLQKKLPGVALPETNVALVFTNEKTELEVDGAPVLTLHLKELKNTVRQSAKQKPMAAEAIKEINDLLV